MNADARKSDQQRRGPPRLFSSAFICVHLRLISLFVLAGCELQEPTHSAAVRATVTPTDPKLATPDYWWNQPPVARAGAADFQPLWDACAAECQSRFFRVDREEYRLGLLTTLPVISKQIFEPWRTDAVTWHDEAESTLATIRRTVRFEVTRGGSGYEVVPKVLVERFANVERRLTAINQYHQAFSGPRPFGQSPDVSDRTTPEGPTEYWYPLHRDADLERDLAAAIAKRVE